jgi:hypothetical protein
VKQADHIGVDNRPLFERVTLGIFLRGISTRIIEKLGVRFFSGKENIANADVTM